MVDARANTILLLILILTPSLPVQSRQPTAPGLAFTHVTLIDGLGGPPKQEMTVMILEDRITAIGKTQNVRPPKGIKVVDAAGKFLIPGLWDMHAHTTYKDFLMLFVANGVTGIRDMGGTPEEFNRLVQWRREIATGAAIGPHIVAAGLFVDGPLPIGRPNSLNVATADEARQAVRYLKEQGADFIKVYSMLPREAYFAIADEAKKSGLKFVGHVPASISALEASDAGQKTIEHLFRVLPAFSTDEAKLNQELMEVTSKKGISDFVHAEIHSQIASLDSYDMSRAAALFARFVRNQTWFDPTLIGWATLTETNDKLLTDDVRLKYIPTDRRTLWNTQRSGLLRSLGPEFETNRARLFKRHLEIVGAMQRAGVKVLAGTDSAGLYLSPGFSLHDELALLVKAGLTPMQALQAATIDPATFLGLSESLGSLEKGKIANMVLLEANPLVDIRNTQKIASVVLRGRLISKSDIQEMYSKVEANAGH
jgi:imidazolonepropionase-like amidohydrolase